jgi:hypothetical protein
MQNAPIVHPPDFTAQEQRVAAILKDVLGCDHHLACVLLCLTVQNARVRSYMPAAFQRSTQAFGSICVASLTPMSLSSGARLTLSVRGEISVSTPFRHH